MLARVCYYKYFASKIVHTHIDDKYMNFPFLSFTQSWIYCYQSVHINFSIMATNMVGPLVNTYSQHSLTFPYHHKDTAYDFYFLSLYPHPSPYSLLYTFRWKGLSLPKLSPFYQPWLFSNQIMEWIMSSSYSNDLKIMDPTQCHFCHLHTWKNQRNFPFWVLTLKTQPTALVISQSLSCCEQPIRVPQTAVRTQNQFTLGWGLEGHRWVNYRCSA